MPVGIAPMGIAALAAYRGDLVLARAAKEARIPMVMSGSSLIRLEEGRRRKSRCVVPGLPSGEPARIEALIDRVAAAGFRTLVVTVDVAVLPSRENNVRADSRRRCAQPAPRVGRDHASAVALRHGAAHAAPRDAALRELVQGARGADPSRNVERDFHQARSPRLEAPRADPRAVEGTLVVKGIMSADDARIARDSGVDGIIVSNHGGRQLESTVSPLRVLPAIARAAAA
jgi:L-lactate dehydrogenase (cytochrome)